MTQKTSSAAWPATMKEKQEQEQEQEEEEEREEDIVKDSSSCSR